MPAARISAPRTLVSVVEEPSRFVKDQALGPDPLDATFTARRFRALFVGKRGAVKSLLMNQSNIAGLGNLYVDEILFQTGVHPSRSVPACLHACLGAWCARVCWKVGRRGSAQDFEIIEHTLA